MAKYVLYLNVGEMPMEKAEDYAERIANDIRECLLHSSDKLVTIPVRRDETTRLEKIDED